MQRFLVYFTLGIVSFFLVIFVYSVNKESQQRRLTFCDYTEVQKKIKEEEFKKTVVPQIIESEHVGKDFILTQPIITSQKYSYDYQDSSVLKPKYIYQNYEGQSLQEVQKEDFVVILKGESLKLVQIQGHVYWSTFKSGMLFFLFEYKGNIVGITDLDIPGVFSENPKRQAYVDRKFLPLFEKLQESSYLTQVYPIDLLSNEGRPNDTEVEDLTEKQIKKWHQKILKDFKVPPNDFQLAGSDPGKYPIIRGDPKTLLKLQAFKQIIPIVEGGVDYGGIIHTFNDDKGENEFEWIEKMAKQIKFENPDAHCPFKLQ